jgi:acyl dehydratase
LRAYAAASGDNNPIHLDDGSAKAAGLPGVIAHGMLVAAYIAERAVRFSADNPGLTGMNLSEFQFRFRAKTLLGDTVTVGGSIREASPVRITVDMHARNQRGEITTTAIAVFGEAKP